MASLLAHGPAKGCRPLLQGIEQLAGPPEVDAVVCNGRHHVVESKLHFGEVFGQRGGGSEGIVAAEDAFDVALTLLFAMVEETELLTAKGGRATRDAIVLEMVASAAGHRCLQKTGYSLFAIRRSRRAKRQLKQAVGMPSARSNSVRARKPLG